MIQKRNIADQNAYTRISVYRDPQTFEPALIPPSTHLLLGMTLQQ